MPDCPAARVAVMLAIGLAPACSPAAPAPRAERDRGAPPTAPPGMVYVAGGAFRMGTTDGPPHETPVHDVQVGSFFIDRTEVTVKDFTAFVDATGYRTESEVLRWSGVFDPAQHAWVAVDGATWRKPDGPGKPPASADEPVTQVSWNDAQAYARWADKRLPTEAEWEYAARAGADQAPYVWGDELRPDGRPAANWWQGPFPDDDTGEDGFRGRAPVGRFAPNAFGLVDMTGNVWEWCADWYDDGYYARSPRDAPTGPASGTERAMRGGSWLCSENYCTNYRPGARSKATPDTGLNNTGFRLVRDAR
jgi:formylglycine-generating enzyme required for sulfatase activity